MTVYLNVSLLYVSVNSGSIKVVKVVDSRCFQRLKLQPFNVDVGLATVQLCNCALCSHFQTRGRGWLGRGGSLYKIDEFWKYYSKRSLAFSDWCLVFRSLLLLNIEYWVLLNIYKISIGDSCQFFSSRLLLLKASNFQRKSWQTTFSSFLQMKRN